MTWREKEASLVPEATHEGLFAALGRTRAGAVSNRNRRGCIPLPRIHLLPGWRRMGTKGDAIVHGVRRLLFGPTIADFRPGVSAPTWRAIGRRQG